MTLHRFLASAASAALSVCACLAVEPPLTTQLVASGLTKPLLVTHAPGDFARIFIVEQNGKIKIVKNGALLPTPFLDVQSLMGGSEAYLEYGLLGLTFHPGYAQNGIFYIMYTVGNSTLADPVIYRYHVSANPDVADPASGFLILRIPYTQKQHRSGWMEFGPDGYFYCATGDGGENDPTNAGADVSVLKGKILRLDVDGADDIPGNGDDDTIADPNQNYSIPPDNPFVGVAGARAEIWHYGLRNAWRDSFDTGTGALYIGDVGQNQREEISYAGPGVKKRFFGWRCWEGTLATGLSCGSPPDPQRPPIYEYDHTVGVSVTGGYVYRGCAIPDLSGTYFFGDWSGGKIWSFRYSELTGIKSFTDRTATLGTGGGLTSFGTDAYGEIYYTRGAGEVRKIVPVTAQGPDCNGNGRRDLCDVFDATSADINHNQVPDECECSPEVCDNLDNDCDGTIDDFPTSCGVGECAATGTCTAGFDSCTPHPPAVELCDGLDNDCNGVADDVAAPVEHPTLDVAISGADLVLSWTAAATATGYDVVRGDLSTLLGAGSFTPSIDACLADDAAPTSLVSSDVGPDPAAFFIVRPVNCGGKGSYDDGAPAQVASRDAAIDAAAAACP